MSKTEKLKQYRVTLSASVDYVILATDEDEASTIANTLMREDPFCFIDYVETEDVELLEESKNDQ